MIALRTPPLKLLRLVQRHRILIWSRIVRFIQWVSLIAWLAFAIDKFALGGFAWERLFAVLNAPLTAGSLTLTLGHVLAFLLTLWSAALTARFVRFVLDEEIYSHLELAPGLPYAISMTLRYSILCGGFLAAVAVLGFDMTKLTILVSAFGIGLGFGLQNILNNFVSGLILLFERPIKVGDVIQMEDITGVIVRIGIRATILRTANGSQVILPNGKFISDRVINWTFGNRQRLIEIPVMVAAGTDPSHVREVLKKLAERDPRFVKNPGPQVIVTKLGAAGGEFQLRVWTDQVEDLSQVRSDLAVAINLELAQEKIAVQ